MAATRGCPRCGAANTIGNQFCSNCGLLLTSSARQAAAPLPPPTTWLPSPPRSTNNLTVLVVVFFIVIVGVLAGVAAVIWGRQIPTSVPPPVGGGPRVMGINQAVSGDGTNWSLLITSTPTGLTTSAVKLTITTSGGSTALSPTAFASLTSGSWNMNRAQFVGNGGTTIVVGDRLLISTTTYPTGYGVQIADSQGILYAHSLG